MKYFYLHLLAITTLLNILKIFFKELRKSMASLIILVAKKYGEDTSSRIPSKRSNRVNEESQKQFFILNPKFLKCTFSKTNDLSPPTTPEEDNPREDAGSRIPNRDAREL